MRISGESLCKAPKQEHDDIFGRPCPGGWGRMSRVHSSGLQGFRGHGELGVVPCRPWHGFWFLL